MLKNIRLILLFAVILLRQSSFGQQVMLPEDFSSKLKITPNAQLVDVRTPDEFSGGHLAYAQNINFRAADFAEKIKSLDKTKPVFVYCLAGGRSKGASELLAKEGFTQIYDLKGGYLKWNEAKLPVEAANIKKTNEMSKESLEQLLKTNKIVLLDFYAEWCGPCKVMSPYMEKLKEEFKAKVNITKIDADANKALAIQYKVDEMPTLLLFKNGKLVWEATGLQTENKLRKILEENL